MTQTNPQWQTRYLGGWMAAQLTGELKGLIQFIEKHPSEAQRVFDGKAGIPSFLPPIKAQAALAPAPDVPIWREAQEKAEVFENLRRALTGQDEGQV